MDDKEAQAALNKKYLEYWQIKDEEMAAALSPVEASRAHHNKELSAFKDVNHFILEDIFKLFNAVDIYHLKRTGSFFKHYIKYFSKILRPYKVDYVITRNITVFSSYRCGVFTKSATLDEFFYKFPKLKPAIAHLTLRNVSFNIDDCVRLYDYLWKIRYRRKIELRIDACDIQDLDKNYPGAPSPFYYFYMILHVAAAKIVRIRRSPNPCIKADEFLNNSSMEKTEQVFFSNTRLYVKWENIHQMLIHISPNNITIEWRNSNFLPRNEWNEEDEKLNLLEWMEKNIENIENHETSTCFDWESKVTIPLEQGTEVKKGRMQIQWNHLAVYLIGISYE